MSDREEARNSIKDIIERGNDSRDLSVWHSDIARMTDMLLWLYNDYAKPCTYPYGNLIVFGSFPHHEVPGSDAVQSIEKKSDGYEVIISGERMKLTAINDCNTLNQLLQLLLFKEFCDWDYYCDYA